MTRLRFCMFGLLEVTLGEHQAPLHFPAQKTKTLLCYLLLHRKTRHPRDQLANLWWGDRDTYKARHSLSTALWRLRQALEANQRGLNSCFIIDEDSISFNTDSDYWLDVDEFEKLCTEARQLEHQNGEAAGSALRRAVALYRDDLLPDCYEEWCLVQRQRLQQMYLFALSHLAAIHTERNEFIEAIACCQQILRRDPLREEIHQELIRLYLGASRPQDALRQYQTCAAVLKQELGVEPMAETFALVDKLLGKASPGTEMQVRLESLTSNHVVVRHELHDLLTYLSDVAETVALAGMQVQEVLHRVDQLLAHNLAGQ